MLNFRKKVTAVILAAAVVMVLACLCSFADSPYDAEASMNDKLLWFDYEDGIVRDGSVNDEPGVIGDEYYSDDYGRSKGNGVNNDNDMLTPSPDMTQDGYNTQQGNVAGVTDSEDDSMAGFWGVVLALIIGAAAILIALFAIPKTGTERTGKRR